jgi:hypothetical protein
LYKEEGEHAEKVHKITPLGVIPVQTGIQCIRGVLDTRLRGYDNFNGNKSILRQVFRTFALLWSEQISLREEAG